MPDQELPMAPSPEQLIEALRAVPEPCSVLMRTPTNIVEMGLIESVEIRGADAHVVLVLTDPSCVHFLGMRRYITDILTGFEGISAVVVTMSTSQLWTSDRIDTGAKAA
jgi:metal-sulfur cluster biosynthetic enzyme